MPSCQFEGAATLAPRTIQEWRFWIGLAPVRAPLGVRSCISPGGRLRRGRWPRRRRRRERRRARRRASVTGQETHRVGDSSDRDLTSWTPCCWISVFLRVVGLDERTIQTNQRNLPTMEGAAEDTVVDDTVVSRPIPSPSCSRLARPRCAPCLARVSRARPSNPRNHLRSPADTPSSIARRRP